MGYIKHHAIVVTSYSKDDILSAYNEASTIGLQVIGPSATATNGYSSILICPDGSKEGWKTSNDGNEKRNIFKEWLRGQWQLEWFEASYGNNDADAKITSNAWEEKEEIK